MKMSNLKSVNEQEFQTLVLESKDVVVVEFGAQWCGPCKKQVPVLEQFSTETSVPVFKVDVDECPALAKTYGIKNIPAVFSFKDGKVHQSLTRLSNVTKLKT